MERARQIEIAKRLLAHIDVGTTEVAPNQHRVPVAHYLDSARWTEEVSRLYKKLPVVAGLSCEFAGPGAFRTLDIVGIPVLLTRDGAGVLHAFLNVCRHRSALVAEEACRGTRSRFTCPYHGWTYDNLGRLIGGPGENTFGAVDRVQNGLVELAAEEAAGLIFVGLTPGWTSTSMRGSPASIATWRLKHAGVFCIVKIVDKSASKLILHSSQNIAWHKKVSARLNKATANSLRVNQDKVRKSELLDPAQLTLL